LCYMGPSSSQRGTAPNFRHMSIVAKRSPISATAEYLMFFVSVLYYYLRRRLRQGGYVIVAVCLFVCLLATLRKNFRTDLHEFSGNVGNGPMNKPVNFDGDPNLDTGIVFRIRHYWEIRKVVSTDCAARRCSARRLHGMH